MEWSQKNVERVLMRVLPLNSKREFDLECKKLSDEFECGDADVALADKRVRDGDPVRRLLWGLCVRVRGYIPLQGSPTVGRCGPLTWVEKKLIDWAVNGSTSEQKEKPDSVYMAQLLRRSKEEVKKEMDRVGPAKGRVGFF